MSTHPRKEEHDVERCYFEDHDLPPLKPGTAQKPSHRFTSPSRSGVEWHRTPGRLIAPRPDSEPLGQFTTGCTEITGHSSRRARRWRLPPASSAVWTRRRV